MAIARISLKERALRFFYFFPFQLVILHFKKNHLLLISWVILWAFFSGAIASKYGVSFLFLAPEYLGQTNYISYGILGFATGGFIMAFNLYSYIMHGFRFPFIASLARPFLKFSINNFIIPLLFVMLYCYYSADYQSTSELIPPNEVAWNLAGYLFGVFLFCFLSFVYFLSTNKDVLRFVKNKKGLSEGFGLLKEKNIIEQERKRWQNLRMNRRTWRVETYLKNPFKIGLARDSIHYNNEIISKILSQNHINASIFEIILITSFVVLGTLRGYDFFVIPAAASLFLLFTMMLMIISAMYSWFKGWTISMLIALFLLINTASNKTSFINKESRAFGLNYEVTHTNYLDYLKYGLPTAVEREKDRQAMLGILENWKEKMWKKYRLRKPKMIFINSSGGGLRSALWNFKALHHLDSLTQGKFYDHAFLVTGSSGGMLGQAAFRELKLQEQFGNDSIDYPAFYTKMSGDMLNPIAVSLVTNDLFIRYQRIEDNGFRYVRDRGYAFEKAFNNNTNYILDKRLGDYRQPEQLAQIPVTIYSPAIVNDARKLLVSSSPVSYLTTEPGEEHKPLAENLSFTHLLQRHQPYDVKINSVLRMNSTFPYILPTTTLPTQPGIDIMDAGFRDNYGLTTSIAFAQEFEDWLVANTSGVVFLQIRDKKKLGRVSNQINTSFLNKILSPLETVYGNLFNVHNFTQDQIWTSYTQNTPLEVTPAFITLQKNRQDQISLSLHLSNKEKQYIAKRLSQNQPNAEISFVINQLK